MASHPSFASSSPPGRRPGSKNGLTHHGVCKDAAARLCIGAGEMDGHLAALLLPIEDACAVGERQLLPQRVHTARRACCAWVLQRFAVEEPGQGLLLVGSQCGDHVGVGLCLGKVGLLGAHLLDRPLQVAVIVIPAAFICIFC